MGQIIAQVAPTAPQVAVLDTTLAAAKMRASESMAKAARGERLAISRGSGGGV
tara:strand:- start:2508 stop:2666 length:159 start_codon:yes stop_codon:yes gene_type:complete